MNISLGLHVLLMFSSLQISMEISSSQLIDEESFSECYAPLPSFIASARIMSETFSLAKLFPELPEFGFLKYVWSIKFISILATVLNTWMLSGVCPSYQHIPAFFST